MCSASPSTIQLDWLLRLDLTFMLAALRNPGSSLYILATLIAAPTIFRCHAHPLRGDLSIGVDGDLVRSHPTHSLGTRMYEDDEDDDPPPPYSELPGPSNVTGYNMAGDDNDGGGDDDYYDNDATYSNSNSNSNSDDSDSGDSDNNPLRNTTYVFSVTNVNEVEGTAKINDIKNVLLRENPADLGKNDKERLSRKYYVIDPNRQENEVEKPAVLKIVNLLKAKELDENAPDLLVKEGEYWKKMEGNMFLWQTDEPIEVLDDYGQVVQWVYMVMYSATHSGLVFDPDQYVSKPLRFIGEWYANWKAEGLENKLRECKDTAMATHQSLAAKGMEIDDYSLNKWVTDQECTHWLPNEINVAFSYSVLKNGTPKRALVRGAKDLELDSSNYNAHFERVQTQLEDKFTIPSVLEHKQQWLKIEGKTRG